MKNTTETKEYTYAPYSRIKSEEEKIYRRQKYNRDYYEKNQEILRAKRREKYRRQKEQGVI